MEHPLYEMKHPPEVAGLLEQMRVGCAREFGVTLTGNRLTLRWNVKGKLVHVHMIIDHVEDGEEPPEPDSK